MTVLARLIALGLVVGLLSSACTTDDPEPTMAEMLAEIEGRELTEAEVAEREEVADFKHRGVSYRVVRHGDIEFIKDWVKHVLATEPPPNVWEDRLIQHRWEHARPLGM